MPARPAPALLAHGNARLAAARRLTRPSGRRAAGLFLAEGEPAVQAALQHPEMVTDVFATVAASRRHADLLAGSAVSLISERSAAALSETVSPQGLIAVCREMPMVVEKALAGPPRLAATLVEPSDPGNLGTVLRSCDAAGAQAVVCCAGADPYGGKAVRASAGSLFHLRLALADDPLATIAAARAAGLQVLATSGRARRDLDELADATTLSAATMWVFGNEANGLPAEVLEAADEAVRIPMYGHAESLNLAAAAAICLYASARAQRQS